MKAVKTIGLSKLYGNRRAVDGLNFEIEQGELYSILGVNGAGKTSLIKMLSCLSRPSEGEALILGKSVKEQSDEVKRLINLSTQETAVALNLTVEENLRMIAEIYGMRADAARRKTEEMIEALSFEEYRSCRAKTLSGGWRRKLSIAMALISQPKILFLDEPTLGLDVLARRELWKLIQTLKGKMTIILTTHYMEEAQALSDRIGIMHAGRIIASGTPEQLMISTNTTSIEQAFIELSGGGADAG